MSKWGRSRAELIEIGVDLARRGYSARAVAGAMVMQHFEGTDHRGASRRLERAIITRFWQRYAGRTARQQSVDEMASALYEERWKPLFAEDDERCFWVHEPSGMSVNCNGGFFYCYAAATKRAYESATRATLLAG